MIVKTIIVGRCNNYSVRKVMIMDIHTLIGEATAYDKKQMLEVKRPKSWLKSVSAFANGEGGTLIFGISDDGEIVGLIDAESDAEKISEEIKNKLDPIPAINLEYKDVDGKKLYCYMYIQDRKLLIITSVTSSAWLLFEWAMSQLQPTAFN